MDDLLEESEIFDYSDPTIVDFLHQMISPESVTLEAKARDLFYAVRDTINYEVFNTDLRPSGLRASSLARSKSGFCLHKSILYVSTCRAVGVPARLVASTVDNHISTPDLKLLVGGTTFLHWYTEIHINETWVKLTPVFGRLLCRVYGIEPLEFDASKDSIHQDSNSGGSMRFIAPFEIQNTPTYDSILELVHRHHPLMVSGDGFVPSANRLGSPRSMLGRANA